MEKDAGDTVCSHDWRGHLHDVGSVFAGHILTNEAIEALAQPGSCPVDLTLVLQELCDLQLANSADGDG